MSDLFIWFNRTKVPYGYPLTDEIIVKDVFDKARPKYMPDQRWKLFNPYKMEFPPTKEYKFPDELYMVMTKSDKTIEFDYYSHQKNVAFVSDGFLDFLQRNGLDSSYYEKAKLLIVDLKGDILTGDKYWALRFGKFDDDLFSFNADSKKRAAGLKDFFLYPLMELKRSIPEKNIFFINEFCYNRSLVFNELALREILASFYEPQIYKLEDFPFVYNNQLKWDVFPYDNESLVK